MKKWFKKNKKVIFTVLIMLVVVSVLSSFNSNVFAKLTHEEELIAEDESIWGDISNFFGGILKSILDIGSGVLAAPFATLLTTLSLIIFLVLYIVFGSLGINDGFLSFPFPDNIVFNRMSFFDPNFINPTEVNDQSAPVYILQGTISSLYYTFFIIALTVFVIAAMIIGIKLAISSIASEKAQYKQALNNWVFGIILLFTVHFLMAGIFALNEGIVEAAYDVAGTIEFSFSPLEAIPIAGHAINSLLGGISDLLGNFGLDVNLQPTVSLSGYSGLLLMFVIKALGGDLVSSIILLILLGQTVALVVMYIKRLFYSIFLGMLAPLIVAVDVIRKSIS
ncbi:MAG: hypothetical protein Q4D02_07865 [Clostridia bacterium]|nr:hypothetical protein [Clostridia bacterium]